MIDSAGKFGKYTVKLNSTRYSAELEAKPKSG